MNDSRPDADLPRDHSKKDQLRRTLAATFRDREAREVYAEGFLNTWIAAQLATVRQQRGLTQKALADVVGTKQPGIARLERDGYGKWNLATLGKIAAALDCRLKVSLETYGSLLEEVLAFSSPQYLERAPFAQDPEFRQASEMEWPGIETPGPIGEMRRKWRHWFDSGSRKDTLVEWLQGEGLPAMGHDDPPSYWLAEGLRDAPEPVRGLATRHLQRLLPETTGQPPEATPERFQVELFTLVAALEQPADFEDALSEALQGWSGLGWRSLLQRPAGRALSLAMRKNQNSARFRNEWMSCIQNADQARPALGLRTGFSGLQHIPNAPNAMELGNGIVRFDEAWAKPTLESKPVYTEYGKIIPELIQCSGKENFQGDLLKFSRWEERSERTVKALMDSALTDSSFYIMEFQGQHAA